MSKIVANKIGRLYPLDVLIPSIEAPVPLKFDQPLPGVVVAVRGLHGNEGELVLVTRTGKVARFAQSILRTSGVQLLNLGAVLEDRVNEVTLAQSDEELLLVTGDGDGRCHPPPFSLLRQLVGERPYIPLPNAAIITRWLMKNKQGAVIGFEKLNFSAVQPEPLRVAFETVTF